MSELVKQLRDDARHCIDAIDEKTLHDAADEIERLQSKLQATEKERDRAVARAERLADLNPERDENDREFEEATKEIEQLNVTNIRHENTIADLQSRLDAIMAATRDWKTGACSATEAMARICSDRVVETGAPYDMLADLKAKMSE